MKSQSVVCTLVALTGLLLSSPQALPQDGLVISEFLAVNVNSVKDDFGESSDYVELYNGTPNSVNLADYYLTDTLENLTQWRFPATNLPAGQHLLVWASGRDRRTPGQALHTNFRLASNGETLALVKPDGTSIVHQYEFGPQVTDRSYGLDFETLSSTSLKLAEISARYFIPTNNTLSNRWVAPAFNDSSWSTGKPGFGFDTNPASLFRPLITTDLRTPMIGGATKRGNLYLRIPFVIDDPAQASNPTLVVQYDDGFIAYLNGKEIARRNVSATGVPNSTSTALTSRTNTLAVIPEEISSLALSQGLQAGTNWLAIQVVNRNQTDTDLLMVPDITTRTIRYLQSTERYFANPTPGSGNASGYPGLSSAVKFSVNSTTFFTPFELILAPSEPSQVGQIRYTINGSEPTTNSLLYTGPLSITNSAPIRARVFEPGFLPGPVKSEAYLRLAAAMQTVSSDMPLIAVHSFGGGGFDQTAKRACFLFVHEPIRGRSSFTNAPQMVFRAGLKIRGSSTAGNAKYNWAVDAWDEDNRDTDIPLLGMPDGAEWVFHAPYTYDPSLIHNPLASEMSNGIDRYAGRYRFAEIYLNERASTNAQSTMAPANYFGVYNIIERIGIHPNRLNIPKLTDGDQQEPEITGGYLMSVDRDFGGSPQESAGGLTFNMIAPKYEELIQPPRAAQRAYLLGYINKFGAALNGRSFTNPAVGYHPYIDAGAWIDFHIVNLFSLNVDALRLSTYFYKDRNGPLSYGPVWDFDRAFGSTDGRDADPRVWDDGTGFFTYPWWSRLFADINFWQAWIDRYQELREGLFSDQSLFGLIDMLNAQVRESAPRDLAKWSQPKRGGTQDSEIAFFKNWLRSHTDFMDTQLLGKPDLIGSTGHVAAGTKVQLVGPTGATIYYTTDGTDPRALHGGIDPKAQVYTEPLTITAETRLVARSRNPAHRHLVGGANPPVNSIWSGPRMARFTLEPWAGRADLVVNELNYHPTPPSPSELGANPSLTADDFEFIELKNVTSQVVDLYGSHFTKGIEFNFKDAVIYQLAPQATLILVKNLAAFTARYGARPNIAGTFEGTLDDGGEAIRLESATGAEILEFTYNDRWYPTTDGHGFSLVLRDLTRPDGSREAWGPSSEADGSPGTENAPALQLPRVVVNEVTASTIPPALDVVELLNQSSAPADISGWYLTDDPKVPKKFQFPANSTLAAGGFLTVDESRFALDSLGTNAFKLSGFGDQIWLFAATSSGQLLGPSHGFEFGPSVSQTSFGRHVTSQGKELFVLQEATSLGRINAGPKIGPIVISEIAYRPPDIFANKAFWDNDEEEFVEIWNISPNPVLLYEAAHQSEWHLRGDVSFNFPTNFSLAASASALIVNFDPISEPALLERFRARYAVSPTVQVLGPYRGRLDNNGGVVRLTKPGPFDEEAEDVAYLIADEVEYLDTAPWPEAADGAGASLTRSPVSGFGNDPASWRAATPSPGRAAAEGSVPAIVQAPAALTAVAGTQARLSVVAESSSPARFQWRFEGANVPSGTNAQLVLDPLQITQEGMYSVIVLNEFGAVQTSPVRLTVLRPATILKDPAGGNFRPGTNLTLRVVATGKGALSYQWNFKGRPIPNATGPTLSLTNLQLDDTGPYTVRVTDEVGAALSSPAVVNVLVRPTFVSLPQSAIALVGDTVLFGVDVAGLEPIALRWRKGTAPIANATNNILRLVNVQVANAGTYSVVATNLATTSTGTNSPAASLVVMTDSDNDRMGDAWETQHGLSPSDASDAARDEDGDGQTNAQEFLAGTDPKDKASVLRIDEIKRTASGTELQFLAYTNRGYTLQFKEGIDRGEWQPVAQVSGRSNAIVRLNVRDPLPASAERLYRLTAPPQFPTSFSGPVILTSPAAQTVEEGEAAVFEVQATGEGELRYQWYKGNQALPAETSNQLTLPSAQVSHEGAYSVQVSDDFGTVTSTAATLTVLQRPTILEQPQGASLNPGETLELRVRATGAGPLTYQWFQNEQLLVGATSSTLTLAGVDAADAGRYRVLVRMATTHGEQRRSSALAVVRVNQ